MLKTLPLVGVALGLLWGSPAAGATVDDLLAEVNNSIKPDELVEVGNPARAQAIAGLIGEDLGLSQADVNTLRIACAEAWLDALRPDEAGKQLDIVFAAKELPSTLRERAGLAEIARWQLLTKQADEEQKPGLVLEWLAKYGEFSPTVVARANVAQAEYIRSGLSAMRRALPKKDENGERPPGPDVDNYNKVVEGMLAHIDTALKLLADRPPEERVPVYALRMLGMEEGGQSGEAVQAWLQKHGEDPAAEQLLASAISASEKFLGQPAPALKLKRVDGQAGEIDLANLRGTPVLVDFFATWCKPCEGVAAKVATAAALLEKEGIKTIGVTLDTRETIANLPAWIAKFGISYPVVGEGIGWDSEVDDAWRVDGIPALVLVSADGKVIANEQMVLGASAEDTVANVKRLIAAANAKGNPAAQPAPENKEPEKPEPSFVP